MTNLNEEQIKMLKNMGALGYPSSKIASVMQLEIAEVRTQMNDSNSDFFKNYHAGADMANYLIDLKLFEMAQSGDIKAIDKLSERKRNMQIAEKNLR